MKNSEQNLTRRQLLQSTAIAGGALAASSWLPQDAQAAKQKAPKLPKDGVILFQGDSITDAGRDKKNKNANNSRAFGHGYPFLITSTLLTRFPKKNLQCFNRGISGNKVPDLDKRWQEDCLAIKPDILSILIGVNDIWHKLNGKYDGTVESYETGLHALLEKTKAGLPETTLVICEPFVLRCGAVNDNWFPEFEQRREACKRVAEKMGTIWVPFQEMFDKALKRNEPAYWAGDGVHPSMAGHSLMAKTWIATVFPRKSAKKSDG